MPICRKRIFCFCFITIFLHIEFLGLVFVELPVSDLLAKSAGRAYAYDLQVAGNNSPNAFLPNKLPAQAYLYELLFGVFLSTIGLASVAISFFRWKANDLSLISFGAFCFLYGARLRAFEYLIDAPPPFWAYSRWFITYLIPIPAWLFMEQFLGPGWKTSVRKLWQIQVVFAIAAISVDSFWRSPGTAMLASNGMSIVGILVVAVNLFRPSLPMTKELRVLKGGLIIFGIAALHANIAPLFTVGFESPDFEWLGFLIFIACLGYIVAYRFFQNEKELITLEHELETARQIQAFILPQQMPQLPGLEITARYVPMATMAGDFFDFLIKDDKGLGILVADVSGHGVPASLIASMVKIAFVSQTPFASDPSRVLGGINRILCGKLESDFVTAGYLYLDTERQTAAYAGAGHPPLLLWRPSDQKVIEFRTKGIVLGQFEDAHYKPVALRYQGGDRFFVYTDGIVEASNTAGELFGSERFKTRIAGHKGLSSHDFADKLIDDLKRWSAKSSTEILDDDLTLVVVDAERATE